MTLVIGLTKGEGIKTDPCEWLALLSVRGRRRDLFEHTLQPPRVDSEMPTSPSWTKESTTTSELLRAHCRGAARCTMPKQTARIAYVRHIGPERRYLIPQAGQWIEVNEEVA